MTDNFLKWMRKLKDKTAKARIAQRIVRIESGTLGDVKYFRGIGEIRINYGPGYRVYFVQKGNTLIILLCGGAKFHQQDDVEKAIELAREV